MKNILGFLKQSWLLTLIGILALSLLIWFIGQMFPPFYDAVNRLLLIGALFVLWGLYYLFKKLRAKRRNQQMMQQLAEDQTPALSPDEIASQEEVEQLDSNLQVALQALKDQRLGDEKGGNKQYVYELPWYVIIGPPGAGKTTLLANSNLQFPLSEQFGKDALRGVGGTRNCDWWFTNEAILLDTAGRYTTQDSNENVDQSAWLGFLNLLKKYRPHQPLNGVMVAVSLSDLIEQNEQQRQQHANTIRQRIDELYEQLGVAIPVYLMFTKSDLLAGFSEYFDDLNREQREQVWGVTFPVAERSNVQIHELFAGEFALLEDRIHGQLVEKLEQERSQERRQALYLFPQQFSALKNIVNTFVEEVFQSSKFHHSVIFRGVYFTSATQEGSPIDRIMGAVASNFGIDRQQLASFSGKGKSFFINRLLKDVIFSESGMAGTNKSLEKKLQWLQMGSAIAAGLATLVIAGLWFASYQANKKVITDYQSQVNEVAAIAASSNERTALTDQVPLLNQVQQLTHSFTDEKPTYSLMEHLGLYQGKSLRSQMDDQYIELLGTALRPHAKAQVESLLTSPQATPSEKFSLLKVYLYLGDQAPKDIDAPAIGLVDWNKNRQLGDVQDVALSVHFNNLLTNSSAYPIELDMNLVGRVRTQLADEDAAKMAYIQLKSRALNHAEAPVFRMREQDGLSTISASFQRKSQQAWQVGIDGLFTKDGFRKVFLPAYKDVSKTLKQDAWVLGESQNFLSDTSSIQTRILQYYQDDYIRAWEGYLNDLEIKPLPKSPKDASQVLVALTPNSGDLLKHIFTAIQLQTDFSNDNNFPLVGDSLGFEVKKVLKNVDGHFKELHQLVDKSDQKLVPVTNLINDLYIGFYDDVGKGENNQVLTTLKDLEPEVNRLPSIPKTWLKKVISDANGIVGKEQASAKTERVLAELKKEVCLPCAKHFKKKFPFSPRARANIDVAKFTEFFSRGGTLDTFKKSQLENTQHVNSKVLKRITKLTQDGDRVRNVFFSTGSLQFNFSLALMRVAPDVQSIELSIGSVTHVFSATSGNREAKTFGWPLSPANGKVIYKDSAKPPTTFILAQPQNSWDLLRSVKNKQLRIPAAGNVIFRVDTFALAESPFEVFNKLSTDLTQCRCLQ